MESRRQTVEDCLCAETVDVVPHFMKASTALEIACAAGCTQAGVVVAVPGCSFVLEE